MNNLLIYVLALVIILLFVTIALMNRDFKNQLARKNQQIKTLTQKVNRATNERRRHFRLRIDNGECIFHIKKADAQMGKMKKRKGKGAIKDVSYNGMQIESPLDIPIRGNMEAELMFELGGHNLHLKGLFIRKEEHVHQDTYIYGIKFTDQNVKEQNKLNRLIREKELERRRKILEPKIRKIHSG